ncbi:MAG TPA: DUF2721 domain-containing protein [Blastocatellia bacterium]|nr:DUF2721 domain-containing protein [Blastocatellia bacterium]
MQIPIHQSNADLSLLSAMITPAVLISACGTLIFSTSTRLARIVDRVRDLSSQIEQECAGAVTDFPRERRAEIERQLGIHARRSRLVQGSLTSFYVALGLFVAATVSIGIVAVVHAVAWLPTVLGIAGTVVMFYGSMLLIAETRLALRSVSSEMEFILRLHEMYLARQAKAEGDGAPVEPENPGVLRRLTQRLKSN